MLMSNPWDHPMPREVTIAERDHPAWLDELVDLHVLTEHGDRAAASAAAAWLASDAAARAVWDTVEGRCRQVSRPDSLRGLISSEDVPAAKHSDIR